MLKFFNRFETLYPPERTFTLKSLDEFQGNAEITPERITHGVDLRHINPGSIAKRDLGRSVRRFTIWHSSGGR